MKKQLDETVRHASSILEQKFIELIEGREVTMEEFAEAVKGLDSANEDSDGNKVVSTYKRDGKVVGQAIYRDGGTTYVLADESIRKRTGDHVKETGQPQPGDLITYDRIHIYEVGREDAGEVAMVLDSPEVLELVVPKLMKELGMKGDIWCRAGDGLMQKLVLKEQDFGERQVGEYSFEFLDMCYPDYFQGAGTAFTEWDDVAIGIGDTPYEAGEDALEIAAQSGWDVEHLKNDMPKEPSALEATRESAAEEFERDEGHPPDEDELDRYIEDGESIWCYVGLYLKEGKPEQVSFGESKQERTIMETDKTETAIKAALQKLVLKEQEVEEPVGDEDEEAVAPDWWCVAIDETEYWHLEPEMMEKIERIVSYYIYDKTRHVHIASLTPSYELTALYTEAVTKEGVSDDDREDIDQEIQGSADIEPVEYMEVRTIDKIPDSWKDHYGPIEDWEEIDYEDQVEEVREYFQGNAPQISFGESKQERTIMETDKTETAIKAALQGLVRANRANYTLHAMRYEGLFDAAEEALGEPAEPRSRSGGRSIVSPEEAKQNEG